MKMVERVSESGQGGIGMGMQLEDMKTEFPVMPSDMRAMVTREVEKQIAMTDGRKEHVRGGGRARRYLIVALAAAMAMGMTAFAGSLYRMRAERSGKYGVDISVEGSGAEADRAETDAAGQSGSGQDNAGNQGGGELSVPREPIVIEPVKVTATYLPDGMIPIEDDYGKYCYADAMYQGGVSVCLYRMDTGMEAFTMQFTNVAVKEELSINGGDGVYLKFSDIYEDEIVFDQRIYVMYPDQHYVLEMYAGSNVTKEEAVAIAEGIRLTPATEEECARYASTLNWSDYLLSLEEREAVESEQDLGDEVSEVSKDRMSHTHAVGENFVLKSDEGGRDADEGYAVRVAQVQVFDNINVLDLNNLDADEREEILRETDAQGNLLPGTMNYIKYGDGVDTVTEIAFSEQVPQKLVYITVEYTNTGDTPLKDVLFYGNLLTLEEDGGRFRIREGRTPAAGEDWDAAVMKGIAGVRYLYYYDVHGGERGNNYISDIEPGGTVTLHLGWIVPEEELKYLYLNLDPMGGEYCFTEEALETGYVDIRQ